MSEQPKSVSTRSKFHIPNSTLFAMGYVDLIFTLKLTNKDLLKPEGEQNQSDENQKSDDRYYHIEDFNTIEDLKFLEDKQELWDKITVSGGNDTLKQLLVGNKISKKKSKIEYFGFNRPIFNGNSEFFSNIFKYVCFKNHLYINETPLEESARYSLNIILYHKGQSKTISLGRSYEEEEKDRIKNKRRKKAMQEKKEEENKENNEEKKEKEKKNKKKENEDEEESSEEEDDDEDEEQNEEDYEETEAMKERKIPKFRRSTSILVKLNPTYEKYSMAYINYVDMKHVPGDFKLGDLNELLKFFKSKGTLIFVNFYKPKKPKIEVEEEPIDSHENDNEIMGEGKSKEKQPEEEEEEKKEEKKEKKEPTKPTKKMRELNQLYDLTNIFFFDTKQCVKIFNKHYENFTDDNINNLKKITRAKIFDYFIKGIAPATKAEVYGIKTGLFIDQLVKLTLIFAHKKAANTQEFDCQPYPKINHNNMHLIKQYKDILNEKKNDYFSIFISSIIIHCASCAPGCQTTEVIYPSFLISLEVIKKRLECEKNELVIDDNIYKVKLDEKIIMKNLQIFSSGGRENGFVLDCTNKEKSAMKDYVSLYDYHLRTFFSSETIRKNLKNKGFIDSKGFIMYDPEHRNVMREKNVKKKKKKVISSEEIMNSIKGIDVPSNIKDKEIDAQKLAENKNLPTDSKLPINKEFLNLKGGKKKRRKRRKHGSSSRGKSSDEWGSSESDSGNNSGNNSGTVSGDDLEDEKDKTKYKNKEKETKETNKGKDKNNDKKKNSDKKNEDDDRLLRDKLVY